MTSEPSQRCGKTAAALVPALALAAMLTPSADAIHVYVLSSGNTTLDAEVQTLLAAHGHTSMLGPQWHQFTGASLAGVDAVYLQMNYNWDAGLDMPHFGQIALRDFVQGGGGLVTTAWAQTVAAGGALFTIRELFPTELSSDAHAINESMVTYTQVVPDPILNTGLPESFSFTPDDISGTEGPLTWDPWAQLADGPSSIPFYAGQSVAGVLAGPAGSGWVINLSTPAGLSQIADANFGRLIVNSLVWVATPHPPLPEDWCPCPAAPCPLACDGPPVSPMHIYIMPSGEPELDSAVQAVLIAYGHTSEIGAPWWQFDGTDPLTGVDVVYMQVNYNQCGQGSCAAADMPPAGQALLHDWVLAGGGLITTEFTLKISAESKLATLQAIFPADATTIRCGDSWQVYTAAVDDPILTSGLPSSFIFPVREGVTDCLPRLSRPEAVGLYETEICGALVGGVVTYGLVGAPAGAGRVINLGSLADAAQLGDPDFARLLVNSFAWTAAATDEVCPCERDGDDAQVDVFDLLAYLDLWFAQDPQADLVSPTAIDVFDLLTFLDCWFAGC